MDFLTQYWQQIAYAVAIVLAAFLAQRLIKFLLLKSFKHVQDSESNVDKVIKSINPILFLIALLLFTQLVPVFSTLLKNEWRYAFSITVVILVTLAIQRIVRYGLFHYLKKSAEKLNIDETAFNFLKNAINAIIILIAVLLIFYSIPAFRALGTTLLASAGILAAIAGFASQQAMSNIIGGIFIVIFKPFRVDDMIRIGTDITGKIEDITLRHTVIRNFENRRVIIPNSVISSETIINSNLVEEKTCVHLEVGISYDSDINLAIKIMQDVSAAHDLCIDNRSDEDIEKNEPKARAKVLALGDYFVLLRCWVWAASAADAFSMKCDLLKQVKEAFDKEGVEIPFPYRTVVYKKDLPANAKFNLMEHE